MNEYIKKSEAVDVIVKYPYNIAGKTATAIKMIEDLPSADVVPKSELEISQHLLKDAWKRIEELDKLCGELQRKYDMTERKFADEEIIKALEWCIQNSDCADCEYREKTDKSDICPIRMDALNLINKQNTEVEQLKRNLEQCENGYRQEMHLLQCKLENAKSELEQLQRKYDLAVAEREANVKGFTEELEKAKAELDLLKSTIIHKEEEAYNKGYADAKTELASEIFAEIEKEIDTGISVIEKILNTKGGRANGKTVLISKYDVYIEAKKHLAELKKKYTEGEQ